MWNFAWRSDGGRKHNTLAVAGLWSLLSLSIPSAAMAKSAADYFVHALPGQPDGPLLKMHAGHIEVDEASNGHLFFWLYENQHIADKMRTVIWLNGGPGCSSEDGALMEIGPYRLKDDSHLEYNPGSWDKFANIIFVDNPIGTGFSYANTNNYLHELDEMAAQFIIFLEKFFQLFPAFELDDLYIAGESYAGQHIPYIAKAILDRNKAGGVVHHWNLGGLLIGNGWISPYEQYPSYLAMAYEAGLVEKGSNDALKLEAMQDNCIRLLDEGGKNQVDTPQCEAILQSILDFTKTPGDSGTDMCYNMYDVSLKDVYPSCGMNWPPDLVNMNPYLRRKDVLQALNIADVQLPGWVECSGSVGAAFRASNSVPSIQFLPDLLSQVPIVLFSGANDLICNHLGTEELINNMEWNGGKGFEISSGNWAPRRDWTYEGEAAGFYQAARNLTYVLFYNSSHMVPFDYALRTQDMLNRFMGIDPNTIAGDPVNSHIDGEVKDTAPVAPARPPPNKPNKPSDSADLPNPTPQETAALEATKWRAYYRAGEVGLVVVIIAAGAWGWYIWKERRKRSGYTGLFGGAAPRNDSRFGLDGVNERFRNKRTGSRDVEAADFDESELDDLHVVTPGEGLDVDGRYDVGSESDDGEARETEKNENRTDRS